MTTLKSMGWLVILATSAASAGCSGSGDGGAGEAVGQNAYPFTTAEGDTFCSRDRGDGLAEVYNLPKIDARIRASESLSKAAAARSLTVVDSCESARIATEVFKDEIQLETSEAPAIKETDPEVPVDKIHDGFATSSGPFVVEVQTSLGTCSGSLISAHYLLTAAHCFPSGSSQGVTVRTGVSASSIIGSGTMTVTNPGFVTGCDSNDIALVKFQSGWASPANTSASWTRVFGRQLFTNATPILYGYGASEGDGSGVGTRRRSNSAPTVTSSSSAFMGFVASSSPGRICSGDSGGPAMTTTTEFPTVAGVAQCIDSTNACPGNGHGFWFGQVGRVAQSFIAATINGDFSVGESCVKTTVSDYSYWTCF